MRIFEDELLEFQRTFSKVIDVAHNYLPPTDNVNHSPTTDSNSPFLPPILAELRTTGDWKKFEDNTYYLLKLLGIQNAYKFSHDAQAGKADGFFRFRNLAVLYDCTIKSTGLAERKAEQIINFCNRLQTGQMEFSGNVIENFQHCNKQVWIITKGKSRFVKNVNGIAVKEIAINDLLHLYEQRLLMPSPEHEMELKLAQL